MPAHLGLVVFNAATVWGKLTKLKHKVVRVTYSCTNKWQTVVVLWYSTTDLGLGGSNKLVVRISCKTI